MTESEQSKPIEELKPAAGAEEKKDEEEQPIRFTKEKICERTLTWQEKLEKLGGYDKLGEHDKLLVDLGREEEEDEKNPPKWPEEPSWYVKELPADQSIGEGVKDFEICSG